MAEDDPTFNSVLLAAQYQLTRFDIEDALTKKRAGWSPTNIETYFVQRGLDADDARVLTNIIVVKVDEEVLREYGPR